MDQSQNIVCANCGTSFPSGCTACPSCGFAPRTAVQTTPILQPPVADTNVEQPAMVQTTQPVQMAEPAPQVQAVQPAPQVAPVAAVPAQEAAPVVTASPLMNSEGQVISGFSNPADALHIAPTADDALPKMPSIPPGSFGEVSLYQQA